MLDPRIRDSPDELVLAHALEKLRAREGLTLSRLRGAAHSIGSPLLSLAAVRRYASVHGLDEAEAALAVAAEAFVMHCTAPSRWWPTRS